MLWWVHKAAILLHLKMLHFENCVALQLPLNFVESVVHIDCAIFL